MKTSRSYPDIDQAVALLCAKGIASKDTIRGCSEQEIQEVCEDARQVLPHGYIYFLERIGNGAGMFFRGTDLFYPSMLGTTEIGREIVREDENGLELASNAFVFSMHQGYSFMFFYADESDDPAVWYYLEQSGQFKKKNERFTRYIRDCADGTS